MAHFYGSMSGNRKEVTRCGSKDSGITTHPRGWNVGVRVEGRINDAGQDEFLVYATGGSHGGCGPDMLVAKVVEDFIVPTVWLRTEPNLMVRQKG